MKLRMLALALVAACATAASAEPAATHQEVTDFVKAAGWEVCDSVANAPPTNVPGAKGKHLVQVGKPCASADKAHPTVLFVLEFDTAANRDAAVAQFSATYHSAIIEMGDAWPIGERFAVFASGPAHDAVKDSLAAEVAKRKAAPK
ncbi:MAG TPA: hypothetical protein VFL14_00130 [Xanthomonadales bacterium]|nr:hypothetical protein [Xanthomonadales bacterium]